VWVESGISFLAGKVTLEYEYLACYDRWSDEGSCDSPNAFGLLVLTEGAPVELLRDMAPVRHTFVITSIYTETPRLFKGMLVRIYPTLCDPGCTGSLLAFHKQIFYTGLLLLGVRHVSRLPRDDGNTQSRH
jgi:hypothetical protein